MELINANKMFLTWREILTNGAYRSIDSTNTTHINCRATFISIPGFYLFCKTRYNDVEYSQILLWITNITCDSTRLAIENTRSLFFSDVIDKMNVAVQKLNDENLILHDRLSLQKQQYHVSTQYRQQQQQQQQQNCSHLYESYSIEKK